MTRDMTSGSPLRCILQFAIPMFFGMLFQQLYNMVDTMIVGRFLGLNALAGVGSTGSLYFLIIGSCTGICNGFAIPVAQSFGARQEHTLRKFVTNSAWLSIILAVVITVTTVLLCRPMLRLMNTPGEAFEYAYSYIVIIFAGIPFTFLYNLCASVIRALGDSKSPLFFLIISSVLNVALDLAFIVWFQMGVAGAALATVLSQGISGVICFFHMKLHFPILLMQKQDWAIDSRSVKMLCSVGLPMGLQYSITAIGSVVIQTAVNSFGEIAVAGVTAAQRLYNLLSCPLEALGATMGTYVGQNVGAKKLDRVGRGTWIAVILSVILSGVILLLTLGTGKIMLRLFIDVGEVEATQYAYRYLLTSISMLVFLTGVLIFRFSIQGMGYSPFAMISGFLEMVARFFVAFGLASWFGFQGVCFANPCAWFLADVFLVPAYFACKKRLEKSLGNKEIELQTAQTL